MAELREHRSRGLRAPAGQSWIAIGGVAYQRQVIGDGGRHDSEFADNAGLIEFHARPPVQLDYAGALYALAEVLIRGTDD